MKKKIAFDICFSIRMWIPIPIATYLCTALIYCCDGQATCFPACFAVFLVNSCSFLLVLLSMCGNNSAWVVAHSSSWVHMPFDTARRNKVFSKQPHPIKWQSKVTIRTSRSHWQQTYFEVPRKWSFNGAVKKLYGFSFTALF